MQDLIGVRVPNAAEKMWIRQRTLQRVAFFLKRVGKRTGVAPLRN